MSTSRTVYPIVPAIACLVAVVLINHIFDAGSLVTGALASCASALMALGALALARRACPDEGALAAEGSRAPLPVAIAVVAAGVICTLAGLVALDDGGRAAHGMALDLPVLLVVCLDCAGVATWEEIVFRRLLPRGVVAELAGPHAPVIAAWACAAVFALLHVRLGLGAGTAGLRFAQVMAFGVTMAGVAGRRGGLVCAIALHAAFDIACFVPAALLALGQGATLTTLAPEALLALCTRPVAMAASLVALVPLAIWATWSLDQGKR